MNTEEHGTLSMIEIVRINEYLQKSGLTGEQIYGFWVYVSTGFLPSGCEKRSNGHE